MPPILRQNLTMSAEKTPLTSKLILIALLLNLGCLLVVIFQQKPGKTAEQPLVPVTQNQRERFEGQIPAEQPARLARSVVSHSMPKSSNGTLQPALRIEEPASLNTRIPAEPSPGVLDQVVETENHGVFVAQMPVTRGRENIHGVVFLQGTPPEEIPISTDRTTCGRLDNKPFATRHYVLSEDGRLANTLAYIKEGLKNFQFPVSTNKPVLASSGCQFEPYVMALQVGQTFTIQNLDPIMHNAHATTQTNKGFNISLVHQGDMLEKRFGFPEMFVRIKCDIHPWMFAYIAVLPHPFFSVTDSRGAFTLPLGLPPGKYVIAARHLKAGEAIVEVTVREGQETVIPFTLTVPSVALTSGR